MPTTANNSIGQQKTPVCFTDRGLPLPEPHFVFSPEATFSAICTSSSTVRADEEIPNCKPCSASSQWIEFISGATWIIATWPFFSGLYLLLPLQKPEESLLRHILCLADRPEPRQRQSVDGLLMLLIDLCQFHGYHLISSAHRLDDLCIVFVTPTEKN